MANNLLTIDMITRKSLEILENNLVISRNVNREYDKSFAVQGAKIGSTLRIRLPDRAKVSHGAALNVQDDNEQFTTLTVSDQLQIGVSFTTAEETMQLDDYSERVLKPRISQLANEVDLVVASNFKTIYNSVGTPGTTPSSSAVLLAGQQKLNENAAVMMPRYATVNPAANAGLVESMKGFFNPVDTISRQFRSGMMAADTLGYDEINMSQNIQMFRTGSRSVTSPTTVGTTVTTQGSTTIVLQQGAVTTTIEEGDVFTVDGVFAVNPQTRQSTGSLQQFVAIAKSTAIAGTWTVEVNPPMYTQDQALATIDVFPQAGAAVTFMGNPSTTYPQNLVYHRDAITLATADLLMPRNVELAAREVHNGISLRVVSQYDINNDRLPMRVDVLMGTSVIRPQMAVRMWG